MGKLIFKNQGFALITTIIFSLIATTIVGILLYVLNASISISGIEKSYTNANIAAKSAADYIISKFLDNESSVCPGACNDNTTLNLGLYNKIGKYNINAVLKNKIEIDNSTSLYSIYIESSDDNDKNKAIIEFAVNIEAFHEVVSNAPTN